MLYSKSMHELSSWGYFLCNMFNSAVTMLAAGTMLNVQCLKCNGINLITVVCRCVQWCFRDEHQMLQVQTIYVSPVCLVDPKLASPPILNTQLVTGPSHLSLYLPTGSSAPRDRFRICASWNMGACVYPGSCSYLHVCFNCHFSHRANNCLETPEDSPFKWNAERGTG